MVTTKYLAKFQSPRAITRPKIIGPERNVNLICNLSLYGGNCFISELRTWVTLQVQLYMSRPLSGGDIKIYDCKCQQKYIFLYEVLPMLHTKCTLVNIFKQNKRFEFNYSTQTIRDCNQIHSNSSDQLKHVSVY